MYRKGRIYHSLKICILNFEEINFFHLQITMILIGIIKSSMHWIYSILFYSSSTSSVASAAAAAAAAASSSAAILAASSAARITSHASQ